MMMAVRSTKGFFSIESEWVGIFVLFACLHMDMEWDKDFKIEAKMAKFTIPIAICETYFEGRT